MPIFFIKHRKLRQKQKIKQINNNYHISIDHTMKTIHNLVPIFLVWCSLLATSTITKQNGALKCWKKKVCDNRWFYHFSLFQLNSVYALGMCSGYARVCVPVFECLLECSTVRVRLWNGIHNKDWLSTETLTA